MTIRATGLTATLLVAGAVVSLLPWWWGGAGVGSRDPLVEIGRVTGLLGAYLLLVEVALVARTPWCETRVGADRVTAWHRALGEGVVVLVLVHAAVLVVGYADLRRVGVVDQAVEFVVEYAGGLTATLGTVALVVVGVTSLRVLRRRLGRERWYAAHLPAYAGIGLGFVHQLTLGRDLVGARVVALWTGVHVLVGLMVLWSRVTVPLLASARHGLRVTAVHREGPDAVSVTVGGHRLDEHPARAGQFLRWRFLAPGLWGQAHPYSLSAAPGAGRWRLTVRARPGDHGARLAALRPGTRVIAEGPSGALGAVASGRRPLLLVAAGIGVTPLRALLDVPRPAGVAPPVLVQRVSRAEDLLFADEIAALAAQHRVRHVPLVGPDRAADLDDLRAHVPDLSDRTAVVCGPEPFMRRVRAGLARAGLPPRRVRTERFRLD